MAPRLAWQAAVEAAHTAGELALQLRALDAQLAWDAARPPAGNDTLAQAQLQGKRPAHPGHGWEYLVKVPALPHSMVTTPPLRFLIKLQLCTCSIQRSGEPLGSSCKGQGLGSSV